MDALTILGLQSKPKSVKDLHRLQKRSKELCKYYSKRSRLQEVKKVEWAYKELKKGVPLPAKDASEKQAGAGAAGAADAGKPRLAPPGGPEQRRELIREKLLARRAAREAASGEGNPEAKRREAIKEKLAAKRIIKKVAVKDVDEGKQYLVDFLAAPAGDAEPEERGTVCLLCPVSIERIKMPARGYKCQHLQCFDLEAFLVNKCPACPVCDLPVDPAADLFVDSYMMSVLGAAGDDANEVAFDAEGGWKAGAPVPLPSPSPLEESPMEEPEDDEDPYDLAADAGEAECPSPAALAAIAEAEEKAAREAAAREEERRIRQAKEEARRAEERARRAEEEAKRAEADKMKALMRFIPNRAESRKTGGAQGPAASAAPTAPASRGPVDTLCETNYVVVELPKPMGLVFESNVGFGGVFISTFDEGGAAALHGRLRRGDQLVGVGGASMMGKDADECADAISCDQGATTRITVFRGAAEDLYGSASSEWIMGLLARVQDGQIKPSPPKQEREKKRRLAMSPDDGGSGDDSGFSETEPEEKRARKEAARSREEEAARRREADRKRRKEEDDSRRSRQAAAAAEPVRASAPATGMLRLEPAKELTFGRQRCAALQLKNTTSGHVAFRIRTNAPKHMAIKPCSGSLAGGETLSARIISSDSGIGTKGLKFVVQATAVPSGTAESRELWADLKPPALEEWTLSGTGRG